MDLFKARHTMDIRHYCLLREKGRDLTESYNKSTYTHRKIQNATRQHKNATKNFDYITIASRLRSVGWGNGNHLAGAVTPIYGVPTFLLTAKTMESKGHIFKNV